MSDQERKDFEAWAKSVPSCSEHARAEVMAYSWLAFKAGRAALAQQAVPEGRTTKLFFSYCPDNGVEFHATAEEAQEATRIDIAEYRKDCQFNGEWADEVEHCYWGEVKGRAVATEPDESGGVDYQLEAAQATGAAPQAEQQASPLSAPTKHEKAITLVIDLLDSINRSSDRPSDYAFRAVAAARAALAAQQAEREPLSQAAQDVLAERQRQISVEGWTPEHDDEHSDGTIALAAGSYCESAARPGLFKRQAGIAFVVPKLWPLEWSRDWWKPSNPRRDLIKAGALILAELERLDRAHGEEVTG